MIAKPTIRDLLICFCGIVLFASCREREDETESNRIKSTNNIKAVTPEVSRHSLDLNSEPPKYPKNLNVVLSIKSSADDKNLIVRFLGEGDCMLMVCAPYSDEEKKWLPFHLEDSTLTVNLTVGSRLERFIVKPSRDNKYDTVISYPIPDKFSGKFSDVSITCLVYPYEDSESNYFDPLLAIGRSNSE
jgi:hypothetical protein